MGWFALALACLSLPNRTNAEVTGPLVPPASSAASLIYQLPNGMRVVTIVDRRAPLVAIDIRYGVGEAMDPVELPGLATAAAGVLARGTSTHLDPVEFSNIARAANVEPWTRSFYFTPDDTQVYLVVPAPALDVALWMEAERMAFQSGASDAETLRMIGDACREFSANQDAPLGNLGPIMRRAVFGPAHPYFIETPECSARGVTPNAVKRRLLESYTPANATLTIVGDVAPVEVRKSVEKYFHGRSGSRSPDLPDMPATPWARQIRIGASVPSPAIAVAWPTVGYLATDDSALDLASRLMNVHLRERLAADHDVSNVGVSRQAMRLGEPFIVWAELADHNAGDRVLAAIDEELAKLRSTPIDHDNLESAQRLEFVDYALASSDALRSRARTIGTFFALTGRLDYDVTVLGSLLSTPATTVRDAVERNLTADRRVVAWIEPDPSAPKGGVVRNEPNRTFQYARPPISGDAEDSPMWYRAPAIAPEGPFVPSDTKMGLTANGFRLFVAPRSEPPLERIRVVARWADGIPEIQRREEVPILLAGASANGSTLAERLRKIGVAANFSTDAQGATVSLDGAPGTMDAALQAVLQVLRRPTFQKDDRDALKAKLSSLQPQKAKVSDRLWQMLGEQTRPRGEKEIAPLLAARVDQPGELEHFVTSTLTEPVRVYFSGVVSMDQATRSVAHVAAASGKPNHVEKAGSVTFRPGGHFVDDESSDQAGMLFFCPISDPSAPQFGDDLTLPVVLNRTLQDLSDSGVTMMEPWSANFANIGGQRIAYARLVVDPANAAKAARAIIERTETLSDQAVSFSVGREVARIARAWVDAAEDSSQAELALLSTFEWDRQDLSGTDQRLARIDVSDIRAAAQRCFGSDSFHVVAYGHISDALAELKRHAGASVPMLSAKDFAEQAH